MRDGRRWSWHRVLMAGSSWRDAPLSGSRWRRVRAYVLRRDGHRCQIAGPGCAGRADTVDHVVALALGGAPYDPGNLRAACRPCNFGSGARLASRAGLLGSASRRW